MSPKIPNSLEANLPEFSSSYCNSFCIYLVERGVNVDQYLYTQDCSFGDFDIPNKTWSAQFFHHLVQFGLEQTSDLYLGKHVGEWLSLEAAGLVGTISQNSKNLGEALKNAAHFSILGCPAVRFSFDEKQDQSGVLQLEPDILWSEKFPESASHVISMVQSFLRKFLIHYGVKEIQWDGFNLTLEDDDLARSMPYQNLELLLILVEFASQKLADIQLSESLKSKVLRLLYKFIGDEMPTLAETAVMLSLSVRQLQRGLAKEGTSFQKTLDYIRIEYAKAALKKQKRSSEFLHLIGFQNEQSFLKFFKKETGTSAAVYRKKQEIF